MLISEPEYTVKGFPLPETTFNNPGNLPFPPTNCDLNPTGIIQLDGVEVPVYVQATMLA